MQKRDWLAKSAHIVFKDMRAVEVMRALVVKAAAKSDINSGLF
jgi:hypothetical protein